MVTLKKFYTTHITQKYINWLNDKHTIKHTSIKKKVNRNDVIKYVKRHQHNNSEKLYRIIYKNKHIGNLRIQYLDYKTATIGILIGEKKLHSKGIGTVTIKHAIKLIEKTGVNTIRVNVNTRNVSSLKIFKRNKFKVTKKKVIVLYYYTN